MAHVVWCRYGDCGDGFEVIAGHLAAICPSCRRPARWTTVPTSSASYPDPAPAYDLSYQDRRFLRQIKIDPE